MSDDGLKGFTEIHCWLDTLPLQYYELLLILHNKYSNRALDHSEDMQCLSLGV